MKLTLTLLIITAAASLAQSPQMSYGDRESLGGGYLRTFKQFAPDGAISAIGIEFDEAVLTGLPR